MHPTDKQLIDATDPTALAWAEEWSQRTETAAAADPGYEELRARIHAALDSDEKIDYVSRRGEHLYNFWRDKDHERGLWRRTDTESYLAGVPQWEVLLDIDALAAAEGVSWVWKGAVVGRDEVGVPRRALVKLSRGGADAVEVREFDLDSHSFVDGFTLPEAKSQVSWLDVDTVIVGTDTGEGSLTTSGYPRQSRLWKRGQALADAELIFEAADTDVLGATFADHSVTPPRLVSTRAIDFYSARTTIDGHEVAVPDDCEVTPYKQWLFIQPRTAFAGIAAGGLGVAKQGGEYQAIFTPDAHTTLEAVAFTQDYLILTVLRDVTTTCHYAPLENPTDLRAIPLPEHATHTVVATSPRDGNEVWITSSSFTQPATLYRLEVGGDPVTVRRAPALFDASDLRTEQFWATSADGTDIPYFVVRSSTEPQPTWVGGYGGFEVSLLPGYSAVRGIAWLEAGYTFVLPNLRGGGEFGPDWHTQATKAGRHKVWEDHQAVLRDLVARGIARPEQIVIRGGSNGGLLTGGALTQYPDAFGAAVIQVPLADMLRYHQWLAGASWMAEYGNPDDPAERAILESYSPVHNVADRSDTAYPPALITTSTRDDRVHPAHARLLAVALDDAGQAVDYFENTEGGHAGAHGTTQTARVEALIATWMRRRATGQLG